MFRGIMLATNYYFNDSIAPKINTVLVGEDSVFRLSFCCIFTASVQVGAELQLVLEYCLKLRLV